MMTQGFFLKLAAGNIKKNAKTYVPYMITCIVTVAMFYMVKSLSMNPGLSRMLGDQILAEMMFLGSCVIAVFAFIFLIYTNSFLMKRRKKEFGLFNMLGMEKRHLAKVLAWETFDVMLISMVVGLIVGIALDKVMFLLIVNMIGASVPLGFFISKYAILHTLILFVGIFFLIYVNSVRQIHSANPIDLLRAGQAGEREPKSKWLLAVLGAICMVSGYYMALTTDNPLTSIPVFFLAVFLVIAGTYMLFTAGSIVFLKLLRKNERYYYKSRHFISVSGMIYRMKQNAVGLANICILSTMVLVMVSATTSLMVGMQDVTNVRYPNDFNIYARESTIEGNLAEIGEVRSLWQSCGLPVTREVQYTYLYFAAVRNGDEFIVSRGGQIQVLDDINNMVFIPLADYNKIMGTQKTLGDREILLYSNRTSFNSDRLHIMDMTFTVREQLQDSEFFGNGILSANIAGTQFIVMKDLEAINAVYAAQKAILTDVCGDFETFYGFDTNAPEEEQQIFLDALTQLQQSAGYQGVIEGRLEAHQSFIGMFGGFFFIGIFLGLLFVMATVLIIYYKQISEGYEDKEQFAIMQSVGMDQTEVKAAIRSQVLTVFFLPLVVAGCHVAAAFPLVSKLLALFGLLNTGLYMLCTLICFLIFAVMYVFIYSMTARTYYRIVSRTVTA